MATGGAQPRTDGSERGRHRRRLPAARAAASGEHRRENEKEAAYIQRNIDATREAYALDDIEVDEYIPVADPDEKDFGKSRGTLENVRLMDPSRLTDTFDQLQQVRGYYTFQDPLDVDRYTIDGKEDGVIVAPREINLAGVPRGAAELDQRPPDVHARVRLRRGLRQPRDDQRQSPDFAEFDLPPKGVLDIEQPRIYFGEEAPDYSIVGGPGLSSLASSTTRTTRRQNGQRSYTYDRRGRGPDGLVLQPARSTHGVSRRRTSCCRTRINADSQILYNRDPRERVERAAPWLTIDADPYPAVVDGRIVWIVDGYTTSDAYPYSQRQALRRGHRRTPDDAGRDPGRCRSATRSTTCATR